MEVGMAVSIAPPRPAGKSLMPAAFLSTSFVMIAVMAWSMWKDTHPEWRSYQEQFTVVERKILLQQKADLERKIQHPDYVADYNAAKKDYQTAKDKADAASDKLDQTEADLEEMDLELNPAPEEGGAASTQASAATQPSTSKPQQANAADLSELDKEMN